MRPNWFLAFPVQGSFLSELAEPPASVRLFHPADVHLTLTFLGAVQEAAAQRAFLAFEESYARSPFGPIEISLGEVVPMGRPSEYTALSALLRRGKEQLEEIIGALRGPLAEAAGVRPDRRPPKPHVTIGRPRRRAGDDERKMGLNWASALKLTHVEAKLDRVALYTWSAKRRERWFQIVAEEKLRG